MKNNAPLIVSNGLDKSAILMLALGEDEASEIFKFLEPREVQKLGTRMAQIKNVSQDQITNISREFVTKAAEQSSLGVNSDDYIRNVLNKALGEDKAGFLLDRILQGSDTSGIESLKWMDAPSVAELIRAEHPQIIATIMVHLERDHAAAILNRFPERLKQDVVLRIATLDGIQPNALRELNEVLSKILSGGEKLTKSTLGGTKTAAEILNFVGTASEQSVIQSISEYDNDLSQKIQDEMFVFENLVDIDARSLQIILRETDPSVLTISLKGTSENLKAVLFANMSTRAAQSIKDELENKGPVRLSEVETAQKEVLKTVRRLAEAGDVIMKQGGEDQFV